MKSIVQKRKVPARTQSREIFTTSQISRTREVRRSGQVETFVVWAVFLFRFFQAVVLRAKPVINHQFFVWRKWMDLTNSNCINPILDRVSATPILDGGIKAPPPRLTLPFYVWQQWNLAKIQYRPTTFQNNQKISDVISLVRIWSRF